MRIGVMVMAAAVVLLSARPVRAEDSQERGDRVLGGVIQGLLGSPQQAAPDAAYTAQERERLAGLLLGGEYATSRQGEPIDLVVLGIPLTKTDHVYSAKPIQPSRSGR